MELKVRSLDVIEPKSVQEVEQQLTENHEKEVSGIPHIDFSNNSNKEVTPEIEQKIEEVTPEIEQIEEELSEEKVLSYIGKRYNKQINSFDELVSERKESESLPEDVAAYMKYKKETGRGFEDFINLNKDFDAMEPDKLVKQYLSATQEGLDSEDIDALMEDYSYDEDVDDNSKIKKIKIERKKIINEAKKFFTSQKEKYKLPLESSGFAVSNEDKQELESYREYTKQASTLEEENNRKRQWFDQKTGEVFNEEFKGFEFNINDKKFSFAPGDAAELKKNQATPANFIAKFLDEGGLMKDAAGYHKSLAIAMHPDKFAKFFYEQGLSDATEEGLRKMKNINMSERRTPEVTKMKDGMQVKAVNPDSGRNLKIRSIKRI